MGKNGLGSKTDPNVFPHAPFPQPHQSLAFAARLIQYKHKKYKVKKEIDKVLKKHLTFSCFLVYYTYKLYKGGFT
jgi:hypothetical protein